VRSFQVHLTNFDNRKTDVHFLAPSRSLLKNNLYLDMLLISESHEFLRASLLSLSASYLKDQIALKYRFDAFRSLRECLSTANPVNMKAILGTTILLLQYAVREIRPPPSIGLLAYRLSGNETGLTRRVVLSSGVSWSATGVGSPLCGYPGLSHEISSAPRSCEYRC
jgi:hypothetical protein